MDYYGSGHDYYGGFYSSAFPLTHKFPPNYHGIKIAAPTAEVNAASPSYYTEGRKYEPAKVIADWEAGYNVGTIIAYASRIGRKPPDVGQLRHEKDIDDLRKIIRHAEMEIEAIEARHS